MSSLEIGCDIAKRATLLAAQRGLPLGQIKCCGSDQCPFDNSSVNNFNQNPEEIIIYNEQEQAMQVQKFVDRLIKWKALQEGLEIHIRQ